MWAAILCCVLVAFVTRILWRRWRYDLHKIPTPPAWPLLGHTFDFFCGGAPRNVAKWTGRRLKSLDYPKLMRVDILGQPLLVVTDDEFIKSSMMSKKDPFPRVAVDGILLLPMMGNNPQAKSLLLQTEVTPYVKAVRKVYATAFQSSNLKAAMPKIQGIMRKLISIIEFEREKGSVEIQRLFVPMTLDAIGSVAFDKNMGGLDGSRETLDFFFEAMCIVRKDIANPLTAVHSKLFPRSKAARHRSLVIDKTRNEWKKLTDEILARDDPVNGEEPFWYGLKHLTDSETKKRVDYDLLLAEVATIVMTGMDTTAHQLSWILALLATRPDVVGKILDELKEHGLHGANQKELQFADLSTLVYLAAVVKEGMRLMHTLAAVYTRSVPRDMSILGYRIPRGTKILQVGNHAFNADIDWNDPDTFKPERWFIDDAICRSHNMYFSSGPRDCPGQRLAMLEMRVAIVAILQKYEVSLVGSYADLADSAVAGLAVEVENGIWLNFSPRKASS